MKRSSVLHEYATALSSSLKGKPPSTLGRSRSWQARLATAALAVFAAVGYGQTTNPPASMSPPPGSVSMDPPTATAPAKPSVDGSHGFPLWYQDKLSNTRLEPCLDTHNGCVLLAQPGFDPNKVVSYPGNFPSEFFYYVVDSDKVTTSGCPAGTVSKATATSPAVPASDIPRGTAKYRAALEGTFLNGTVQQGQQITFGRTKIVASGLCPGQTYTFRHPYGTDTIPADSNGQIVANKKGGTIDTGCGAAPCNFADADSSRVLSGFLVSAKTPDPLRYLGDAVTLTSVKGSPVGQNFFSVSGQNTNVSTSDFTVSGRIAGPVMVSPYAADFGVASTGGSPASTKLTVTNISPKDVSLNFGESGPNHGDFFADATDPNTTCSSTLKVGAKCDVILKFKPSTTSGESAQIQLGRAVDEAGTGSPSIGSFSLSPSSIDFGLMRVRGTSNPQTVTVTNTSTTAPLQVTTAVVSTTDGTNPGQFGIASDNCTGQIVPAGGTSICSIAVTFSPTTMGTPTATTATLTVAAGGAVGTPAVASLSGTPTGGVSTWSGSLSQYGFPTWYQDESQNPTIKLKPCLGPNDPYCVLLPDANFNPTQPLLFDPTSTPGINLNFPSEAFYFVADSDKIPTNGCQGTAPGLIKYRAAVEEAFLNGVPKMGEQITFGRTKIVASGLCPSTLYTIVHPYGSDQITTNSSGQIVANKKGGTVDVGCGAAGCDFSVALGSRVFGGFLQWDTGAPDNHLGDGALLHTIIGSPFKDLLNGNQLANYLRIYQGIPKPGDAPIGQTNLFTVAGALYIP